MSHRAGEGGDGGMRALADRLLRFRCGGLRRSASKGKCVSEKLTNISDTAEMTNREREHSALIIMHVCM